MMELYGLQTILECTALVLLIVGAFNEDKLAKWERKMMRKLRRRFTKARPANVIPFRPYEQNHYGA